MAKRARKPPDAPPHDEATEAEAFARAMADVARLPADPRGRVRAAPSITVPPAAPPATGDDDGAEGDYAAPGVSRRELRKVKRGEYVVDGRLDLHGVTEAEARASVARFIENSRHRRHRCVCIMHGRGLHSEGNVPVLKGRVREWLRGQRAVLAYADAPRSDGGSGAVYVLLRT